MAGKITIQDIAQLAGVSKTTVSRVLNHKPDVDSMTRERVLRVVDEQRYFPSIAAARLAGGRSHLIGTLVPPLTWPLIPEIMRGVAEVIDRTEYELVLYSVNSSNHEKDRGAVIDRILTTKLTDGMLAMYPGQSASHLVELYRQGFPVVVLDDQGAMLADVPRVDADQFIGAYEATRHLIQLGHRRIAHIQGPLRYQVSRDRYEGYRQALVQAGIAPEPELVLEGDFMPLGGRRCASRLFERGEQRPTAIFAGNDLMAYGVFAAAEHYGLRIPGDVAVVGFDDVPIGAHLEPALTTVRQPLYEMGQRAIELLLNMIELSRPTIGTWNGKTTACSYIPLLSRLGESIHIKLATKLIVRASCGSTRNSALLM